MTDGRACLSVLLFLVLSTSPLCPLTEVARYFGAAGTRSTRPEHLSYGRDSLANSEDSAARCFPYDSGSGYADTILPTAEIRSLYVHLITVWGTKQRQTLSKSFVSRRSRTIQCGEEPWQ